MIGRKLVRERSGSDFPRPFFLVMSPKVRPAAKGSASKGQCSAVPAKLGLYYAQARCAVLLSSRVQLVLVVDWRSRVETQPPICAKVPRRGTKW